MKKKLKTVKEWLEQLPQPYREKALINADKDMLNASADDLLHALTFSFHWSQTPEGVTYWSKLYEDIESRYDNINHYHLRETAKRLVDIGNYANEYLRGNVNSDEFNNFLDKHSDPYFIKIIKKWY